MGRADVGDGIFVWALLGSLWRLAGAVQSGFLC